MTKIDWLTIPDYLLSKEQITTMIRDLVTVKNSPKTSTPWTNKEERSLIQLRTLYISRYQKAPPE